MAATAPPALRRLTSIATGLVLLATGLATAPAASADRLDTLLTVGERLEQGDSLATPDGRVRLQLDHVGSLTLIDRGDRSGGYPEEYLVRQFSSPHDVVEHVVLQADGNLVGYAAGGVPVVDFRTTGSGAVAVRVQSDRNIVLTDTSGRPVGSTGTQRHVKVRAADFLLAGDTVPGERGSSRLTMQSDGNLVLYRGAQAVWSSQTAGNPGAYAFLQGDGNLVVYSAPSTGARRALFDTGTGLGLQGRVEVVVEDFEVAVNGTSPEPPRRYVLWGSAWRSDRVVPGDELDLGDRRTSPDGRCVVTADQTGLVQICGDAVVWSSPFPSSGYLSGILAVTRMQTDGNLVSYRFAEGTSRVVDVPFQSGTSVPGSHMVIQDDRNVVVYSPVGRPTWSRKTGRLR